MAKISVKRTHITPKNHNPQRKIQIKSVVINNQMQKLRQDANAKRNRG